MYKYTTLHSTTLITLQLLLQQLLELQLQIQLQLHDRTPQYTRLITLHYRTLQLQLQLQLHYTNYSTRHLQLTTLQLQLRMHYTTIHPAVVGQVTTEQIEPFQLTQLQLPFGPSVGSLCHP